MKIHAVTPEFFPADRQPDRGIARLIDACLQHFIASAPETVKIRYWHGAVRVSEADCSI
jgi:hypothetical protein